MEATLSSTLKRSMTTAEVVLDANVIVGYLDPSDSQHARAREVTASLREAGMRLVLLDFIVEEALSVLCRRSRERKSNDLHLNEALGTLQRWHEAERIQYTGEVLATAFPDLLEIVRASMGTLNSNDAKLVYLQRLGLIGHVTTFDQNLIATPDFRSTESVR